MSQFLVYSLCDPRDGRIRYVGRTTGSLHRRRSRHCSASYLRDATHKNNWLRGVLAAGHQRHTHGHMLKHVGADGSSPTFEPLVNPIMRSDSGVKRRLSSEKLALSRAAAGIRPLVDQHGVHYAAINEAAAALNSSRPTVTTAIRNGNSVNGFFLRRT